MNTASPSLLNFVPLYQTRVWGGRRLETLLGRVLPDDQPYGESWDLVDRPGEQSVVSNGTYAGMTLNELWTIHRTDVFGACYSSHPAERFPLLIKVLDCADDLSLQVHPPAALAPLLGGEPKTEMWYVAHADRDARLYAGLRQGVTRDAFECALQDGSVADCVHGVTPIAGDSMYVPSGRLHALGKGLLIYEIQQNSDTTYRVFDWNRVGLDGCPRELHVAQSMQCIDFNDFEPKLDRGAQVLAQCEHFRVSRVQTGHPGHRDRFRLIMPVSELQWGDVTIPPGKLTLCPAAHDLPSPAGEWLEIELPPMGA